MRFVTILLSCLSLFILGSPRAHAFSQSSPHLILNFAQINELPWSAPEEQWQQEVKPKVIEKISTMRSALQNSNTQIPNSKSTSNVQAQLSNVPILGWSTLLEYMNFPMDIPTDQSPYVVKTRRILEIAEELDFPVFVPLNGFQWWDELPELYNWWDPDGTNTDPRFFARQDNPVGFKARFIAGFDPENQDNVLWQSPKTPMKLNYRNWGGGGFRLAPPPNLQSEAYLNLQHQRLRVITTEIQKKRSEWTDEGKEHLFAGLSIGTEISLNASVTPADEFKSYGGTDRVEIVRKYLEDNARLVTRVGIPKALIYTHVLGEQDKNDPHYGGIAESAFNLYSNPGVSLYGYAKNPTGSSEWNASLEKVGNPPWGILEYNAGDSTSDWANGLGSAVQHAGVTVIYNWDGLPTKAIDPIRSTLSKELKIEQCTIENSVERIQRGIVARLDHPDVASSAATLTHGIYTKFTVTRCADGRTQYTQPEVFTVPHSVPPDTTPRWVKWLFSLGSKTY